TGEKCSSEKVKLTSPVTGSWQTLSENSRKFLATVMDSVMLSLLCQQSERKDDAQKHLNLLKERVLRSFKTLKVPPKKLGNLKNVMSLRMAEQQVLEANEESLVQLQEEINEAERSAERIEETTQQLQYKIQTLKNQLEEDEKQARKVFPIGEEILKIKNQKGLLKDLNNIQQSPDLRNMLTLIEKAYGKVDFL
ncbi:CENPQ protein, partial [Halcyon senegalensis]|nr:CENPQ protein [Halcyon senegalensis]